MIKMSDSMASVRRKRADPYGYRGRKPRIAIAIPIDIGIENNLDEAIVCLKFEHR
jgi:hypothetical protein